MHIFYSTNIIDDRIVLSTDESNHAKNVLRLKDGEIVNVLDGIGNIYICKIVFVKSKSLELDIISCDSKSVKHPYYLHIAIAPTKNIDRIEWFVEKATEIGIDEISFIQTERSERKHINIERLQKITVAAIKQSVKTYLPKIHDLQPYKNFISHVKNIPQNPTLFIAHLEEDDRKSLKHVVKSPYNQLILIGPEGDFSQNEINLAYKNDFAPVSLGNYRLRTETAALVACATVSLMVD